MYFPKDALAAMFHWSHSIKDSTKPSLICVPMFQSDKKYSPYFKTKNYRTNRQMDEWTEIPFNKSIMYNNVQLKTMNNSIVLHIISAFLIQNSQISPPLQNQYISCI